MIASLPWITFVLIGALIAGLIVLSIRRRAQLIGRLAELSRQKGWQLEARPEPGVDCLLRGASANLAWELRYTSPVGSDGGGQSTVEFSSHSVVFPGTLLLYPRPARMKLDLPSGKIGELKGITGRLFSWSMKWMGVDVSEVGIQPVGTTAFLEKYLVLAPDAESARRLVGAVETQLLNWPAARTPSNLPAVVVDPKGVRVRVVRDGTSQDQQVLVADRLATLGASVVGAFQ